MVIAAVCAIAVGGGSILADRPARIQVETTQDLQAAIDEAPVGALIVLAAGSHQGPVLLDKRVSLVSGAGAEIAASPRAPAAVSVAADDVQLEGLTVSGGDTGIRIREVEGVTVRDVTVRGANLHGVEVVDAAAEIVGTTVTGLRHAMAQGIEIRNSDGRADSRVEDSRVVGGQEGIVSHVSEVVLLGNEVTGTTMRGIVVTEMSDGVVTGNVVRDSWGTGLYCGDMSRCRLESNDVSSIAAADGAGPMEGWGLVVTYHAVASSTDDVLEGEAGSIYESLHGRMQASSPLEIGAGWRALVPVSVTLAVATGGFFLLFVLLRPAAVALSRGRRRRAVTPPAWLVPVGLACLVVQTFHMIEHGLQVFRVRVDGVPSRGGLAGPAVEAEWVHLIYNVSVLLAVVLILAARSRGWEPRGPSGTGDRFLVLAAAVQSYHVIEHTAKVVQHLASGAKVNDGIAGAFIDLVLLHFGLNLIVYVACLAASVAYVYRRGPVRLAAVPAIDPPRMAS